MWKYIWNNGENADPIREYLAINQELIFYSTILANKSQIEVLVLNKIDDCVDVVVETRGQEELTIRRHH